MNRPEKFFVSASWGGRLETADSSAKQMLKFLAGLEACHPAFGPWYFAPGKHPGVPVPSSPSEMAKCLEEYRLRDDRKNLMQSGGYLLHFVGGTSKASYSTCRVHAIVGLSDTSGGRDAGVIRNTVSFEPAHHRYENVESRFKPTVLISVLREMINVWKPDDALVGEVELAFSMPRELPPSSGWVVYLSKNLAKKATPPSDIHVEDIGSCGALWIAESDDFTMSDPSKIARVRKISCALSRLRQKREFA